MLGPSSRPPLPTSSSDFALPPSTSSSSSNTTYAADDLSPFMLHVRRPSLLVPRAPSLPDRPQRSPLAASMIRSGTNTSEESESDRENVKMQTDTPPSGDSGSCTPLLPGPVITSAPRGRDTDMKASRPRSPSTPPPSRKLSDAVADSQSGSSTFARAHSRRFSQRLKPPRIRSLVSESRPEDDEMRSEAQFQRLVASFCELPSPHRVQRPPSDRGRYPEEADVEEPRRPDTPSDDGELEDSVPFSFVDPIAISKSVTPAASVNGEDMSMLDSPGGAAMDVDVSSSVVGSPAASSWRYTPPPTSSAVRTNKRKMDDRYDPYPTTNKRRAVSPSISFLRDNQPSLFTPRTPSGAPRLSMPIPIPVQGPSSATSSPIIGSSSSYYGRGPASALSSPTLRAQIGLGSPVLRPIIPRPRRHGDEEREVEGAGDGVNGLSLG
ncbi:uncharacterized protein B0H18DRAFT_1113221 [Fomitopsis serialis]|uniref:uncharacterized protein n=1 Tax=Fomitopsis serialis TaxID=139415 RepID=UPI0020080E62|nr:uncharacterized protein B0H18DRAFT_1113221 [Neoantrodia serialis]KAH9937376.1 hypothetical protein B0H18DRAFT_1113221 [Neoantrodia serialis]